MANVARIFNGNIVELCSAWDEPAVYVSVARLLKGTGAAHAELAGTRSDPSATWEWHGPSSSQDKHWQHVLLCGARGCNLEAGRVDVGRQQLGAATPHSLYGCTASRQRLPSVHAAVGGGLNFSSIVHSPTQPDPCTQPLLSANQAQLQALVANSGTLGGTTRRQHAQADDSPPRASFKVQSVSTGAPLTNSSKESHCHSLHTVINRSVLSM